MCMSEDGVRHVRWARLAWRIELDDIRLIDMILLGLCLVLTNYRQRACTT